MILTTRKDSGTGVYGPQVPSVKEGRAWPPLLLLTAVLGMFMSLPGLSLELGKFVSIDAALRGIVQHGRYHNANNEQGESLDSETGGAAIGDLDIDLSPTPNDTFSARLRFVKGNSLNNIGGIEINPYNGPLEDDVRDINDSGRNYLMELWYQRALTTQPDTRLTITGGIIDSTNYIDQNRYANDEITQFMNPVFATPDNSVGTPSYDPGAVLEWRRKQWSLNAIYMRTSNDILQDANYIGTQVGYHYTVARGAGNVRATPYIAKGDVKKDKGDGNGVAIYGLSISIDQELGPGWGIFLRASVQNDEAPVVYDSDLSVGVSVSGLEWGRPDDVLGMAYGHLFGSSAQSIKETQVAEAYIKFQLVSSVDFTIDVQYEKDHVKSDKGNPQAWIFGSRLNIEF